MSVELFTRHFLGIYFLLIGILFTTRTLGLYQRLGFSHINYGPPHSVTWWNRQLFNGFRAVILGVCLVRIVLPIDNWLGVIPLFYEPVILLSGMVLMLVSFGLVNYVQGYLQADWRSGIDERQQPRLVTAGPYGLSRNPSFIAVILGQVGFFLALPSVFSALCLMVGVRVLVRQVKAEEAALERLIGAEYLDYRQRVPRWL